MLLDFLAKPFSPEETKSIFTDRQKETLDAIDDVNELYTKHGYDNISNFMRGISAAETQTGKLQSSVSYSPFQIDPIRYEDIVLRTQDDPLTPNIIEGGAAKERADIANEYLRDVYGDDFDILNLSKDMDMIRNPDIGAFLTRLSLANIEESVPKELHNINPNTGKREKGAGDILIDEYGSWKDVPDKYLGESGYWKKYWNTDAGEGTVDHYTEEKNFLDSLIEIE